MRSPPNRIPAGPAPRTNTGIRYVAELEHVREVALIGASDLGFWSDSLRSEGLEPVRCGDAAQIVVVAAEMVYLGVRFAEVSFSVRASPIQDGARPGLRLIHAFTSSRVFAWCERTLFGTPYFHGDCRVSVHHPPSIRVKSRGGDAVSAEMSAQQRSAIPAPDENFELPVFLPPRGASGDHRLFFARVRGETAIYPFSGDDRFAIGPSARAGVLRPFVDSRFRPQEWRVRADASHAKSRTYRRTDVFIRDHADNIAEGRETLGSWNG